MMNTSGQQNQGAAPSLCTNACGFYGNPTTRNLCSKCYRDLIREETRQHANQPASVLSFLQETSHTLTKDNVNDSKLPASTTTTPVPSSTTDHHQLSSAHKGSKLSLEGSSTAAEVQRLASSVLQQENLDSIISKPLNEKSLCEDDENARYDESSTKPIQMNTQRCFKCNKKVGLLGFRCRCEYVFCGAHRHADGHQCIFDYKTYEREQLSKANQKVVASKINRL